MPINFFDAACIDSSDKNRFGLCDNPHPAKDPAFIDDNDSTKWIAEVQNNNEVLASFYAIDHCVEIIRPDGNKESRCDGMLHYNNTLAFVELKDRVSSGWLSKGRDQLTTTIKHFVANDNASNYVMTEGYVCNKQHPLAVRSINTEIQKFKDDTALILGNNGLLLKADRNIVIS